MTKKKFAFFKFGIFGRFENLVDTITTLPIANCGLLIGKKLDSFWSLYLIYSGAGMTN
jgi:hypothetical protein